MLGAPILPRPEGRGLTRTKVSFKRSEPDWELLGIPEARHLPAVLWKQRNLAKLPNTRRRELVDALERVLFP